MCLCIWSGLCSGSGEELAGGRGEGEAAVWRLVQPVENLGLRGERTIGPRALGSPRPPVKLNQQRAEGHQSHQGTEVHQGKWGTESSFQKRHEGSGIFLTMGISLGECGPLGNAA